MTGQRQPLTRRQREFFDHLRSRMEAGQDAPSLRAAAEDLGVSHTAVAGLLQTLQDKGWLERQPHAEDRRSLCLTLSAEGQALYQALQAARQTLSTQVLAGCDDATQAQLLALLARVRGNLDALPPVESGEDCGHGTGRPTR